jgi:very-short-patch-repair endonuclease
VNCSVAQENGVSANRARDLRKKMTPPERRLWNVLRLRPDGFKFRRQHPLGPYTLDFFCYEAALCVEVDGLAHELGSNPRRDIRRDDRLASQGIRTLRIATIDVRDNLEGVVTFIVEECRRRTPSPPLHLQGRCQPQADGGAS